MSSIGGEFSTTRSLTSTPPDSSVYLYSMLATEAGKRSSRVEGGLRTRGLFKSNERLPVVTVITVTYNCGHSLEETIRSVLGQTYPNIEYIVIDGGSKDNTLEILQRYDGAIDFWLSEPDKGIYDAMNKGVQLSTGTWLNFMNAKDRFFEAQTVESVAREFFSGDAEFVYSDVLLTLGGRKGTSLYRCDHRRLILNHQAAFYKKRLHAEHGLYVVAPKVTISDYFFFSLIDKGAFQKASTPIALYDTTGTSQSEWSVEQKVIVDYLLNGMPKMKFGLYFYFYYYYRQAKSAAMRLLGN